MAGSQNTEKELIQAIQALFENLSNAVLLNSQLGEFFKTSVGVRRGCILSPFLFNLYLEKIRQETLHGHQTSVSIGGRSLCNLRFADDIDLMGGSNGELQDLTNRLVDRATTYGTEVITGKNKIMTNSKNNISADISMNGQKQEEVTSFKYLGASLGATLCKNGTCLAESSIRIASAMARLNWIWRCNTISFVNEFKLYKSLLISTPPLWL